MATHDSDIVVISESDLRSALLKLHGPRGNLSRHPFTGLAVVRQFATEHGSYKEDYGEALKAVLTKAVNSVWPYPDQLEKSSHEWREHFIVREQFLKGASYRSVHLSLALSQSEYYREQKRALSTVIAALVAMERAARRHSPVDAESERQNKFAIRPAPPAMQLDAFVGRTSEIDRLKKLLISGHRAGTRIVAITGLPGSGKTTLVANMLNDPEVINKFRDGVLWGAVGRGHKLDALADGWLRALGVQEELLGQRQLDSKLTLLRERLASQRAVLVLDDVWSIEAAELLNPAGPDCVCIVTTRLRDVAALLAGEHTISLAEFDARDSLELLKDFAPEVIAAHPTELSSLIDALGGLPLTLALAGRYLRRESYSRQDRRIREALDNLKRPLGRMMLFSKPRNADEVISPTASYRVESLATVIATSEAALGQTARLTLRKLAVFRPKPITFSEEAALVITESSTEEIDKLIDAGLLETRSGNRLTIHQSIAEYASFYLPQDDSVWKNYTSYYTKFVEDNATEYALLAAELENIRHVLDLSFERGYTAEVATMAVHMGRFYCDRGMAQAAVDLMRRARAVFAALPDKQLRCRQIMISAEANSALGDCEAALADYEAAQQLAVELDDRPLLFAIWDGMSLTYARSGDTNSAINYGRKALLLAQATNRLSAMPRLMVAIGEYYALQEPASQLSSDWAEKRSLAEASLRSWFVGLMNVFAGNTDQGLNALQEALRLADATGNSSYIIHALGFLSAYLISLGRFDEALGAATRGLALGRNFILPRSIAFLQSSSALARLYRGDGKAALERVEAALVEAANPGMAENLPWLKFNYGVVLEELGEYERAFAVVQESLALMKRAGQRDTIGYPLALSARLAAKLGLRDEALVFADEAETQAPEENQRAYALIGRGAAHEYTGNLGAALEAFSEAIERTERLKTDLFLAEALWGKARVSAELGDIHQARASGGRSLELFERMGDARAARVRQLLSGLRQV